MRIISRGSSPCAQPLHLPHIPAVRIFSLVGIDSFIQRLKLLGFTQLKNEDYYGFQLPWVRGLMSSVGIG